MKVSPLLTALLTKVVGLFFICVGSLASDGLVFENLDFEAATILFQPNPRGEPQPMIFTTDALPWWRPFVGPVNIGYIAYNSGTNVDVWLSDDPSRLPEDRFQVVLNARWGPPILVNPGNPNTPPQEFHTPSITQTAFIPATARSLLLNLSSGPLPSIRINQSPIP
jgi:hypothetical protein